MGKGSNFGEESESSGKFYTWDEIKKNNYWIVINGKVYNVQNFIKKHPGGDQIIMNHATQDATVF
jgi:cytochrome b involved in lipid metabolism